MVEILGVEGFAYVMGAFSIIGALMFLGIMKPNKPDQVPGQALPPPPPKVEEDEKQEALIDG